MLECDAGSMKYCNIWHRSSSKIRLMKRHPPELSLEKCNLLKQQAPALFIYVIVQKEDV